MLANYRSAIAAGWEENEAEIIAVTHTMAFLLGAVEPGGKRKLILDPDVTTMTAKEKEYLVNFEEVTRVGLLVCAMGAINHITGQGKLQGFPLKVTRVLGIEYRLD